MIPVAPPFLSVVLPAYRGARHLPDALAPLAACPEREIEILAYDDGSDDDSPRVLSEWRSRLPMRVETLAHTGNWVELTNRGLAAARGEWISLLHQDDRWSPARWGALRTMAARHPDAGLLVHAVRFVDDAGVPLGLWRCPLPCDRPWPPTMVLPRLSVQNIFPLPAVCFRRRLLAAAGSMDPDLWFLADWDFWLRLAARATTVCLGGALADFRLHAASQTAVRTGDAVEIERQFRIVQQRARSLAAELGLLTASWDRLSELSVQAYLWLLGAAHGRRRPVGPLLAAAWRAGPAGCWRYARWARLLDRVLPRWKLQRRARRGGPVGKAS